MKSYCPIICTVVYHEINFAISAKDDEATMMMRPRANSLHGRNGGWVPIWIQCVPGGKMMVLAFQYAGVRYRR